MSRHVFFFFLVILTALPAPLRAEKNIISPALNATNTMQLEDLEPPIPLPEQKHNWLIPTAAALLALVILLFFLARKKKPQQQLILSPDKVALLALTQMEQLVAAGDCPAFTACFDQTLRHYLEAGLGLAALRQTASELIKQITGESGKLPEALKSYRDNVESWLQNCEAGKFAEASLSQEEMTTMTEQLRTFIEAANAVGAKKEDE